MNLLKPSLVVPTLSLFRAIGAEALLFFRTPARIVEQQEAPLRAYLLSYGAFYLVALIGMTTYGLLGGFKYFNPRYLLLIPTMGFLGGLLVFGAAYLTVYYLKDERGLTRNKIGYLKYLVLCFLLCPAAYLIYPLKLAFPAWNLHCFFPQLVVSLLIAARVYQRGSQYFKKQAFVNGFILAAIPYFAVQFFSADMAAFVVAKLGL
ncbi:MAG: hypothetical protein K8S54_14685 [Spirochaetia bacterium]|nr:hypothetical protein [Spirochaetia bacterium]